MFKRKYGLTYPTWEGLYFAGICVALSSAALMRQINLLMLISGLMLGPLVYSWFACRVRKGWFQIQRRLPETIHANTEFLTTVELTNVSRATLFALVVRQKITREEEQSEEQLAVSGQQLEEQAEAENTPHSSLLTPHCSLAAPLAALFFFPRIKPGEKSQQQAKCVFQQPGEYRLHRLEIICRFPLGLFECRIRLGRSATFWVYPALLDSLPEHLLEMTAQTWNGETRNALRHSRSTGDFHSVAPHRQGESARLIHWRSSARRGELVVKRFQSPQGAWIAIIVGAEDGAKRSPGIATENTPHSSLLTPHCSSLAATMIFQLCRRQAQGETGETHIFLAHAGVNSQIITGIADAAFYHQAMRLLAGAIPGQGVPVEQLVNKAKEMTPEGTKIIVL